MALIECVECGKEISSAALACPQCGHPQQAPAPKPPPLPPAFPESFSQQPINHGRTIAGFLATFKGEWPNITASERKCLSRSPTNRPSPMLIWPATLIATANSHSSIWRYFVCFVAGRECDAQGYDADQNYDRFSHTDRIFPLG
jgi:hypothetical protein